MRHHTTQSAIEVMGDADGAAELMETCAAVYDGHMEPGVYCVDGPKRSVRAAINAAGSFRLLAVLRESN